MSALGGIGWRTPTSAALSLRCSHTLRGAGSHQTAQQTLALPTGVLPRLVLGGEPPRLTDRYRLWALPDPRTFSCPRAGVQPTG